MKALFAGLLIAFLFGTVAEARSLVDIGDPQTKRKGTHIAWVDIDLDGSPEDIRIWWKKTPTIKIYWGNGNQTSQPLPRYLRNEKPEGVVGNGGIWWVVYSVRGDYEAHYVYVAEQIVIDFDDELPMDGSCPLFSDGVMPNFSILTHQPTTARIRIEGQTYDGGRYSSQYFSTESVQTGVGTIYRAYFTEATDTQLPSGAYHWEMLANDAYEAGCILISNSPVDMPVE